MSGNISKKKKRYRIVVLFDNGTESAPIESHIPYKSCSVWVKKVEGGEVHWNGVYSEKSKNVVPVPPWAASVVVRAYSAKTRVEEIKE